MSFLRQLWQRIRNPRGFVGRDLEGNRYFELPNPQGESWARTKRVVKYRRGFDMWTYVAGERRLPVQWTSWLTHTRPHPPSIQELQQDLERQRRVKMNAALIEARDREASARQLQEPQAPTSAAVERLEESEEVQASPLDTRNAEPTEVPTVNTVVHEEPRPSGTSEQEAQPPSRPEASPSQRPPLPQGETVGQPISDETQTWVPRSLRRGAAS